MNYCKIFIFIFFALVGCQNKEKHTPKTTNTEISLDTVNGLKESKEQSIDSSATIDTKTTHKLLLTSNALQLIHKETGSTIEIPFGKPIDQMIKITNTVLQSKPSSIATNTECGAGPLKMATYSNGFTLVFQQNKADKANSETDWKFAGWYASISSGNAQKLTTMAGIKIGSTKAEMESAYVITVSKTTLGYEFSTSSGLYGIFDGPGKEAKITSLWSGVSCNFR